MIKKQFFIILWNKKKYQYNGIHKVVVKQLLMHGMVKKIQVKDINNLHQNFMDNIKIL